VLNPTLRFIAPYQTVCNYWNYMVTLVNSVHAKNDPYGYALAQLLISDARTNPGGVPFQQNSMSFQGATKPANGGAPPGGATTQHLHDQIYGAAVDSSGRADCEGGQRGYPHGRLIRFADPALNIVKEPRTPGLQGPTYAGRARVPRGQTFAAEPETGPRLP
jgi:hypothetical protein